MKRERLKAVYNKMPGACWYCGCAIEPFDDWEIEHQRPRSQGGLDHIDNLVPACRSCNMRKGARTVEEYRHSLMVNLEHQLSGAMETLSEHWRYIPNDLHNEIYDLIYRAADLVVNTPPVFCGEDTGIQAPEALEAEEAVAIQ